MMPHCRLQCDIIIPVGIYCPLSVTFQKKGCEAFVCQQQSVNKRRIQYVTADTANMHRQHESHPHYPYRGYQRRIQVQRYNIYSDNTNISFQCHSFSQESLPFCLIARPTSPMERQQNREILEMAEKIRFEKEQELNERQTGLRLAKHPVEINFFDYFQAFIYNYTKKGAWG